MPDPGRHLRADSGLDGSWLDEVVVKDLAADGDSRGSRLCGMFANKTREDWSSADTYSDKPLFISM